MEQSNHNLEGEMPSEEEDQVCWLPDNSGFFFFQQVNLKIITWEHHLFESISNQVPIQKFLTKMIREKNTPKKVKILIWSVAYGSLNMMDESKDTRSWLSLQH